MLDVSAQVRIAVLEQETSLWSVVVLPLLAGAVLADLTPWSRYLFESLSQKPLALRARLGLNADHQRMILRTRLEQARSELFGQKEQELVERAKRDEEVASIDDEGVKERLLSELNELRAERDRLTSETRSTTSSVSADALSGESVELIVAAGKGMSGTILVPKTLSERFIKAGDVVFGNEDAKSYARYESALEDLEIKGYVKSRESKRQMIELTHKGWSFVGSL